jgi:hypothetical protein
MGIVVEMAKAGRGADQYMLRFPPGLRDRIKAYAERQGTSINTEIINILEREFPEQWPLGRRLQGLAETLSVLAAGEADPRVQNFLSDFEETVTGIITGRVTGVDGETRDAIEEMWEDYRAREQEAAEDAYEPVYNEEEERALGIVGRPEKYAEPPPEKADPRSDVSYLMDVLPRYDLAEFTKRLSQADIEGAKAVLDNIPKDKLEKQIKLANMSLLDRLQMEMEAKGESIGDPFEDQK